MDTPAAHPLALPPSFSPDALDTTVELAAILARLQPPLAADGVAGVDGTVAGGAGVSGAVGGAGGAGMGAGSAPAITPRDLPTATDGLKHKLQHARAQARQLPDMARTIAQQEAEIAALEARRERMLAVLAGLREECARVVGGAPSQAPADADRMEM